MASVSLPGIGNYGSSFSNPSSWNSNGIGKDVRSNAKPSVVTQKKAAAEYYSSEKLFLQYTSKDGDTVSLRYESVEYQKAQFEELMSRDASGHDDITQKIKEEILSVKQLIVERLTNGKSQKVKKGEETQETPKIEIPEYWNAENTSQRIVDFATSFFSAFEGKGEEFLNMMKSAIDEGFSQAREILGAVPEEVGALTDETYALVMEKIDNWAAEMGISVEGNESGNLEAQIA